MLRDNRQEQWGVVDNPVGVLHERLVHDDWKSSASWLAAQSRYMRLELDRVATRPQSLRDRLRRWPPLMPILMFFYCLFGKGLIFNGRAGLFYALQRTIAEAVFALLLIELRIKTRQGPKAERDSPIHHQKESSAFGKSMRFPER